MKKVLKKDLLKFDREHIWHPYTSMADPLPVYPVASAKGVRLILEDERELIDGMSSWWAAIHGYNVPELNNAVQDQIANMSHVMFGGLTHRPAVELASLLIDITPEPLQKVFFSDSGSVSIEVAIKMAVQYWSALGYQKKQKLLTIRSGYHGDTLGAMSVCDPVSGMHYLFKDILPQHFFADTPRFGYHDEWEEKDIISLKDLLKAQHEEIAAIIMEPIVQGAGGMSFYSPQYLRRARELSQEFNVLLILDEIATGFGRTGSMFACEKAGISPDIMSVGKALTGGYLSLAATLTTQVVSDGISSSGTGSFMHGPTFMANPLACSVAKASIRLLLSTPWKERIGIIESHLTRGLSPCMDFSHVHDVRILGAIGVVELKQPVEMASIQEKFVNRGVWLRPFGKLVYTMPPYIINKEDLTRLTTVMTEVIGEENGYS
ncbi:adenosylmethionine--8-amino-7-oxononanoate transaminase [Thermodesulfobacteriota bacterium]